MASWPVRPSVLHDLAVPVLADAGSAAVGLYAWWQLRRLNVVAKEPRVGRLAVLFLLLAGAFVIRVLDVLVLERFDVLGARTGDFGPLDALFWGRHALTVGAIVAGAMALGRSRPRDEAADHAPVMGAALVGAAPVLLFFEGMGFAYLAIRAGVNHLRRTNLGSLQVTLGFFLLTAAWLVPLIIFEEGVAPLGPPHWSSSILALAGMLALALVVPRRGAPRA